MFDELGGNGQHALVLREGVEGDMTAAMQYLRKLVLFVGRAVGMRKRAKLFERETCFAKTACGSMTDEFTENGKRAPQSKGLEGKDYLHIGSICHMLDKLQVASKQRLLNEIIGTHGRMKN